MTTKDASEMFIFIQISNISKLKSFGLHCLIRNINLARNLAQNCFGYFKDFHIINKVEARKLTFSIFFFKKNLAS